MPVFAYNLILFHSDEIRKEVIIINSVSCDSISSRNGRVAGSRSSLGQCGVCMLITSRVFMWD